ncbi:MAG TPA: Y-family DNA polymerase [Parachlamydiaceae bacterium]|nr:Y-family DNA polymerase [Parachlamydiaceae bacterium]
MSYFAILDCNNFYASCERLFNPALEGKPVIVLSNNDGCVVARSQEAKQLKIEMGAPFFKIKDFCTYHKVHVFSSNYQLYGDLSQRVMDILMETGLEIEVYSIDEAFIQFPDTVPVAEAEVICADIRNKIKKWVGLPTAIGLAPTKTLAKLANDKAKKSPQGIFNLCCPAARQSVLETYPIEDVWGIGRSNKVKLNRIGIYTVGQFCEQDPMLIRRHMGVVGERMLWELRGHSCLMLESDSCIKKSITCSRSFGSKITEVDQLAEAMSTFANTACIKLRQQGSYAQGFCIFLESAFDPEVGRGRYYSHGGRFAGATQDTSLVIAHAKSCLNQIYQKKEIYKKCGIILLDFVQEEGIVADLFQEKPSLARSLVMDTFDTINAHFGKGSVFFGAMGTRNEWKMRADKSSKFYTTSWSNLAVAKA